MAEYALVSERALTVIPPEMPLDLASVLGCAVSTGLGSVWNVARVAPGETVAVIGCGGVGISIVQGARISGASSIIAIDRSPERREIARQFGATDVVDPATVLDDVLTLTDGLGVDHAFEAVGSERTIQDALAIASIGGAAYNVGVTPPGAHISVPGSAFNLEAKSLIGSKWAGPISGSI